MSRSAKMVDVYNALIVPTMTYGAESWVLKKREKERVQTVEVRVLRKIAGVCRIDHVRNKVIREQGLGQEGIVEKVCRKREAWNTKVEVKRG